MRPCCPICLSGCAVRGNGCGPAMVEEDYGWEQVVDSPTVESLPITDPA